MQCSQYKNRTEKLDIVCLVLVCMVVLSVWRGDMGRMCVVMQSVGQKKGTIYNTGR